MPTLKQYEVRGFVYTTDGKRQSFSTIVEASSSSAARGKAEAEARRDYGSAFKNAVLTPHEIR